MSRITFFDWRNDERPAGVAVSFTGEESGCSCHNVDNPTNPYDWDVSIHAKMHELTEAEEDVLRHKLAEAWQFVEKLYQ